MTYWIEVHNSAQTTTDSDQYMIGVKPDYQVLGNLEMDIRPTVLYSSYKNDGATRFKVSAPDGTCVIGGDENCLITRSTIGLPGSMKSITLGDQVYRIRYTGPESSLERFSITSK